MTLVKVIPREAEHNADKDYRLPSGALVQEFVEVRPGGEHVLYERVTSPNGKDVEIYRIEPDRR